MGSSLVVDLFGTLVPKWPSQLSAQTQRQMAEYLGVAETTFIEAWQSSAHGWQIGRKTPEESVSDVLAILGLPAEISRKDNLCHMWRNLVQECIRPRSDGVLDTLRWCRENSIKVGLVSNAGPDVPPVFRRHYMATLVDTAVFSCEVGMMKPDPLIYWKACEQLGVEPVDCIYVGDGGSNELDGALHVGMKPVMLKVQSEIEEEGLPPEVADWTGAMIDTFCDIRHHLL